MNRPAPRPFLRGGWGRRGARALAVAAALLFASGVAGAEGRTAPEHPLTVAVLYFDYGGKDAGLEPLRQGLAQMLISDLASTGGVKVVERERLQDLLNEQERGTSGKLDARTAARIGKLLGAQYLVLGNYFDVLNSFRADARLVDVETGEIVKSLGASGKADDFLVLEQSLADGLRGAMSALAKPGPGASGPPRTAPPPPRKLKTKTAVTYGRALMAVDSGDRKGARTLLQKVLQDQPDFALASRDLDRLIR
jgi:TolB-like protein